MPTYAYACKNCGHRFDAVQSFAEPALTVCPECDGELRKEYGSIGVTFNGSGFYRTDSRAGGTSGGDAGSSGTAKTAGGEASSTPTSSKSDAKASAPAGGSAS